MLTERELLDSGMQWKIETDTKTSMTPQKQLFFVFNNVTLLRSKYCCVLPTRNINNLCASWRMRSLVLVSLKQKKKGWKNIVRSLPLLQQVALRCALHLTGCQIKKKKACTVKNWWFHNICTVAISKVFTIFAEQCSKQKKQIVAPKEAETPAATFNSWEISQHPNHNVRSRDGKIFNPA